MAILLLISIMRYLINGLFIFYHFDNSKKHGLSKTLMFSILYTFIVNIFKYYIIDTPIIIAISSMFIFSFLFLKNNIDNKLNFVVTYTLITTCILEYTHFLVFQLISASWRALKIPDVTYEPNLNLISFRLSVLVVYFICVFAVHRFKRVNTNSIRRLSNYRIFPLFLGSALFVIIYLKYKIKYTTSDSFHYALSFIFALFMLMSFIFVFSSETFINIIESLSKKKINPAIEEAKLQKSKGFIGLKFITQKLNFEMNRFLNMLGEIDIDTEDKKSKQIAYCAVLLNHEENPQNTHMISTIYFHAGNILDRQAKTIESNISNAIKTHWTSCSAKTLEKINKNYKNPVSTENGCPGAKEFLLYLTQKYKEQYPEDEIKSNAENSFFKKYLLNIQN